jgi:hypothetical protein
LQYTIITFLILLSLGASAQQNDDGDTLVSQKLRVIKNESSAEDGDLRTAVRIATEICCVNNPSNCVLTNKRVYTSQGNYRAWVNCETYGVDQSR